MHHAKPWQVLAHSQARRDASLNNPEYFVLIVIYHLHFSVEVHNYLNQHDTAIDKY